MRALSYLAAAAAGALTAYYLDPEQGRRRRAVTRDQLTSCLHRASDASQALARDLRYRARGLTASARGRLGDHLRRAPVPDDVLAERVRARIGRAVTHSSIDVEVVDGEATLRGPVLDDEIDRLLRIARATNGVRNVVNRLEPHRLPGNVPGLQS